jgi:hypothetical protein
MKRISLLFVFVALFASASFAGTKEVKNLQVPKIETKSIFKIENQNFIKYSCTVTTSYTNSAGNTVTLTATVTSTVSQLEACVSAAAATMLNI